MGGPPPRPLALPVRPPRLAIDRQGRPGGRAQPGRPFLVRHIGRGSLDLVQRHVRCKCVAFTPTVLYTDPVVAMGFGRPIPFAFLRIRLELAPYPRSCCQARLTLQLMPRLGCSARA